MQVRVSCAEQLLAMCAWGGGGGARAALSALGGAAPRAHTAARLTRYARHAQQFLQLLCRLVALAGPTSRTLEDLALEVSSHYYMGSIFIKYVDGIKCLPYVQMYLGSAAILTRL